MNKAKKSNKALPITLAAITAAAMLLAGCDQGQQQAGNSQANPTPGKAAATDSQQPVDERRAQLSKQASTLFGPLPVADIADKNPARVELGRKLYYDTRLSQNNNISCNSCHMLDNFGVDNEPTSPGHEGQRGKRNSPSVYNASLHIAQFWDGRTADLTGQAKRQVLNPLEMAMPSEGAVVARLAAVPGYVELFVSAFPEEKPALTFHNMARAIATFEEGLLTPGRFDDFMNGDLDALNDAEVSGLEMFIQTGCTSCHAGPALGGTMYRKMGLVKPYETEDEGRFAVTGKEADKGVFKVPSLRNVAETGPYLHDGGITRLMDAIHLMAEHQLGRKLSDADAASIAMFLESLTGEADAEYIKKPELPEGNGDTTMPDAG